MATIFIIDDEPQLLGLISTFLRLQGHDVNTAGDPISGYKAIIDAVPAIDLLITDTDMKPLSGLQLVSRVRAHNISCPVIFMSGHHGLAAIFAESFDHRTVLEKPFTAAELRSAVQKALLAAHRKLDHAI